MLRLLLLPLLWAASGCPRCPPGSRQEEAGFQLRVPEAAVVQEGLCALVPCSFSYLGSPPPAAPHVSWFWGEDSVYYDPPVATNKPGKPVKPQTQGRFHLLAEPGSNSCSLHITDARRSDAGGYVLLVEEGGRRKYHLKEKWVHLQVTDLTAKPDIRLAKSLRSGRAANLICSLPGACEGPLAPTFSWAGAALGSSDPRTRDSPLLTLTPRPQDNGTHLTCRVQLRGGLEATERTVRLLVSYAPQNLSISTYGNGTAPEVLRNSSLPVREGQALHLLCAADANPPAQLSWFRGPPTLNASPISNSEVLELPRVGIENEGQLTCRAQNALGSAHVSLRLSVLYPSPCPCESGEQEGSWPLILTLIRGSLMGAGFLLTYCLTWIYYTRCGGPQGSSAERRD
ncbi:sialic acid-binding Ig-like lectin 14 [Tamandua tetradactyla]|uniref:sialic acid-binding Ig-like lectin 14 n=1 Tax=Tamandua tetradactyla TaxID=48850 RepID=UPI0040543B26